MNVPAREQLDRVHFSRDCYGIVRFVSRWPEVSDATPTLRDRCPNRVGHAETGRTDDFLDARELVWRDDAPSSYEEHGDVLRRSLHPIPAVSLQNATEAPSALTCQ